MRTSKKVLLPVALALLAALLGSCATTTLPAGVRLLDGVYHIPNEGVEVNGRSGFRLKPGDYRFATDKPGHRRQVHVVAIENRKARLVRVTPGRGFAIAEFTFTPEAESVLLADAAAPDAATNLAAPWRASLDEGRYRIDAETEGHLPITAEFEIQPNRPVHLDLAFTPKPTSAPLLITTSPPGGELLVDGSAVGAAPKNLEAVPFGSRRIAAYVYRDADNRLAYEGELAFGEHSPSSLELVLDVEQRRFEGAWYGRAEADRLMARRAARERRAAENAYRSARTEDAVELRFPLPVLADKEDSTEAAFAEALFELLRVGDRVRVDLAGTEHLVWKRSDRNDASFRRQVAALWNNEPIRLGYDEDPAQVVDIQPEPWLITTVAYHLYRQVNDCPILDLGAAMHDLEGIEVHTLASDGDITVLTFGGRDFAVDGRSIEVAGQFGFDRLDAGERTLRFTWSAKPQRILVVSSRNVLARPRPGGPLALNEKRLLDLGVQGDVQAVHAFTRHLDGQWRHAVAEQGGLPGALDYNTVAIGPHDAPGDYTREWLVHYQTGHGRATRQVPVDYTVDDTVELADPGEFIRHDD